ncbi:phosphatidic acid phosphatase type 2/haloperoxidase [Jimgerdemannia flammicorona]|uniref:Dolichyldiphosphatase n=1 Tax=Jimgerdemannia flammicorona TaxID=994334 RepID=A0A433D719_9FUNG|nr:phosphatidic acid phosphatase type 2/haloperoxidase [Jimgerdemannia flammicorona]
MPSMPALCPVPTAPSLTSLSLTHVQFDPADKLAYLLAYITLSPLAILAAYASTILARREIAAIVMLAGQLVCELLNATLKEVLQETRPCDHLGKGYGMPSSHAQFAWYFSTYLLLYTYTRITVDNTIWKHLLAIVAISFSVVVSYSRIYLGYHTLTQVIYGASFGVCFAVFWYTFTEHVIRPQGWFSWAVQHPWGKLFYLRDSRDIPNVARWEYQLYETEIKAKRTKVEKKRK